MNVSIPLRTQYLDPLLTLIDRLTLDNHLLVLSINAYLSIAPCDLGNQHSTPTVAYLSPRPHVKHIIHCLALLPELQVGATPTLIPALVVEHVGLVETLKDALFIEDALLHNKLWVQSQQVVSEDA